MNPPEALYSLYGLALGVMIVIAFGAAIHPRVPTGIVGTILLGGIVMCELAAVDRYGEAPIPNWRALQIVLEAGFALWMAFRWYRGSK